MKTCLFCDATKLTLEHVFPEWVIKLFPKQPYNSNLKMWGELREDFEKTWSQNTLDYTARVVCEPCNTGWMSDIEGVASPILTPIIQKARGTRRLSQYAQRVIANWVTLRAMVFDRARNPAHTYYRDSILRHFATQTLKDKKPQPPAHIWLATLPLPDADNGGVHAGIHSRSIDNRDEGYQLYNCSIGGLAIQMFDHRGWTAEWIGNADRSAAINLRKLNAPIWKDFVVQVWPIRRDAISWPPKSVLPANMIAPFYNRFVIPN